MIDCHPFSVETTVLARMVIAPKHVTLAERDFSPTGNADVALEPDDGRQAERNTIGTNQKAVLFNRLSPSAQNHRNRPAARADVQRFVTPV